MHKQQSTSDHAEIAVSNRLCLAAIYYERDFDINGLLRGVVRSLQARRAHIGGVLQEKSGARLRIVDIRTGRWESISQNRGAGSRGCKLDPRGLAAISSCIAEAISRHVDLIVINKFGRAESEGGGLLSSIGEALSAGLPVLTSVREPYAAAWESYHGGLSAELRPQLDAVLEWVDQFRVVGYSAAS